MDERKQKILDIIIREFIATSQPVASSVVVNKYKLEISPATVRNEMAELEAAGYIAQPHTSAGRVPTIKAYDYFVNSANFCQQKKLDKNLTSAINQARGSGAEADFKNLAKTMAEASGLVVFWAVDEDNLYYTGIGNLLQQPEFRQSELIDDISIIIDHLEEIICQRFGKISLEPKILLGVDSLFGDFSSTILTKYRAHGNLGVFGVLGPARMDYEKNFALINYVLNLLQRELQ